jgi:hypothetical protein
MADQQSDGKIDLTLDPSNLYRDESYTDMKSGAIRVLTPVKADLSRDETRTQIYIGSTQLLTPQGPLPVQSRLAANSFKEALEVFTYTMTGAVGQVLEELEKLEKEMQKKDDSRIIVPGR